MQYYLAVDIGASSGRHILGWVEDGIIHCREMYRFSNQMVTRELQGRETLCWDTGETLGHILAGLRACREAGCIPATMAIDTWGVDYALVDEGGALVGDTIAYRDHRTDGMEELCDSLLPFPELYARVGIQRQPLNTIYQLLAHKQSAPEQLKTARSLLFIPDYLNFLLTGVRRQEYTIASTSALLDAETKAWDAELLSKLGLPGHLFGPLSRPGTTVGALKPELAEELGFTVQVILGPSHDTASAYMATPSQKADTLTLSSGTWSLLGVELDAPLLSAEACRLNFTNEGGYGGKIRFLRNIMGLWMLQSVRRELAPGKSYAELEQAAKAEEGFTSIVDASDMRFLSPDSMHQTILTACRESGQPEPQNIGQYVQCVYRSLARCYREAIAQLQTLTGKPYDTLHIVGGGSKDHYLNGLTARETGLTVYAGPEEGTALGNLMCQMIAAGLFASVNEARTALRKSFPVREFIPSEGSSGGFAAVQ